MTVKVRRVEYFRTEVDDRPGTAYQLLNELASHEVNLFEAKLVDKQDQSVGVRGERTVRRDRAIRIPGSQKVDRCDVVADAEDWQEVVPDKRARGESVDQKQRLAGTAAHIGEPVAVNQTVLLLPRLNLHAPLYHSSSSKARRHDVRCDDAGCQIGETPFSCLSVSPAVSG